MSRASRVNPRPIIQRSEAISDFSEAVCVLWASIFVFWASSLDRNAPRTSASTAAPAAAATAACSGQPRTAADRAVRTDRPASQKLNS